MTVAQKLEKASGILFFSGFLLSKLQYVPFPLASALFRFISLGAYFLAYSSWSIACLLHPDHKKHNQEWYGFAQIKEQFLFSSFLGLLATILSVAAVFVPLLSPAAAWLFLIANALWVTGEYHKWKNPPQNNSFSSEEQRNEKQKNYVYYAMTTCAISLVAAVSATLIIVFPPLVIPITFFSFLVYVGLGSRAIEFLFNSITPENEPTIEESYKKMDEPLGLSISPEPSNSQKRKLTTEPVFNKPPIEPPHIPNHEEDKTEYDIQSHRQ